MSHERESARNRCSDPETPIGVLVESQDLSCEGHAECNEEKKHTHNTAQLARIFVGAKQKDLDHVDQYDRNHKVRAPAMQAANEPTKCNIVIESLEAVPSFTGGRHVDERQHDAGNDLQHKNDEGGAAKNIKPAGGFAGDGMLHGLADGRAKLETRIQPLSDGFDQTHVRISLTILEA